MNYISCPKIEEVKVLEAYNLEILFDNGIVKKYDFTPNFKYEVFALLKDYSFFKDVKVDQGGYGVSWNDEIDMAENELWINGVEITKEPASDMVEEAEENIQLKQ